MSKQGEPLSNTARLGLLIVDDEPRILSALKRLFFRQPYRVLTAHSGEDALAILHRETVAIVISDMKMPYMDGAELLGHVAQHWPDTQRILLTGQSGLADTVSAINSGGIFRYLRKPWNNEEILTATADAAQNYLDKQNKQQLQNSTQQQNQKLKSKNRELLQTVESNINALEETHTQLNNARELEEKLRQERNKAEQLSQAKSRFLATMSHEIRSPLNAIITMNKLLLDSHLSDEQRELAKIAHDGGQNLLALINDILDFSQIDAGNLKLSNEWFNVVDLVNNIVELLSSQTINKDVEIISVFFPNTPVFLHGDPKRVRQILINIINNAVKFTEVGGITIYIKPSSKDAGIEFVVEDTGIGISEDNQNKIFDEFYQVDNSESRSYGGTGLGLSICLNLINLMKGKINVNSKPGRGSRFTIYLPLDSNTSLFDKPKNNAHHLILIDSNNKTLIAGLAEQLSFLNHRVVDLDAIKNIDSHYQSFTFIIDIQTRNDMPAEYQKRLKKCLAEDNPALLDKHWELACLVSNDGIGKVNKLKTQGFKTLLRKPVRLASIIKYLIPQSGIHFYSEEPNKLANKKLSTSPIQQASLCQAKHDLLLVEDSEANQAIVKAILGGEPFNIDLANNGLEALEKVAEKKYHAILMDVSMPQMDGIHCTRQIRAGTSENKHTVIIAMTAKAFAEDREHCIKAGMNDYITKPIDTEQFIACLYFWLQNQPADTQIEGEGEVNAAPNAAIAAPAHDTLIDIHTLEQLVNDTSKEILPEILAIYFTECNKRIPAMLNLFQSASWQLLSDQAHALKSSSGSFGATRLAEVAKKIEQTAATGDGESLTQEMQHLDALSSATIAALENYCQHIHP